MLVALQHASPTQTFLIRAHVGNYSLFITGIFRESVESRAQRGAPDLSFYEDMGRTNYRAAASHQVARSAALSQVFEQLADGFREVRSALNHLSDSLLHLDPQTRRRSSLREQPAAFFPNMTATLFSDIQRLFERTYASVGINLEDA